MEPLLSERKCLLQAVPRSVHAWRSLLALIASLACLWPAVLRADTGLFVGVGGGSGPFVFAMNGDTGFVTTFGFDATRWESIDALAVRPGDGAYVAANTLGFGTVLQLDGSVFVPFELSDNLTIPVGMVWGRDSRLYVGGVTFPMQSETFRGFVKRYDGATGAFVDTFIEPGSGGLSLPYTLRFHDGSLFIADQSGVLRYDAGTGAFQERFIDRVAQYLAFGPSGDLFLSDTTGPRVLRFDGRTGAFKGSFVNTASGGLGEPRGLDFGTDGNLYVVDAANDRVLRYNGQTGAFAGTAADLAGIQGASLTYLVAIAPVAQPPSYVLLLAGLCVLVPVLVSGKRSVPETECV